MTHTVQLESVPGGNYWISILEDESGKLVCSPFGPFKREKVFWKSSSTLGDSVIYQSGSDIGIGTTAPAATLEVNGKQVDGSLTLPTPSVTAS